MAAAATDFYEENPDFVGRHPVSAGEELCKGGLRDLSVSRASFSWGVPVPDDDAHVMYVWLDALTNYLTATGWPVDGEFGDKAMNERFWPADFHMVGRIFCGFMGLLAGIPDGGRASASEACFRSWLVDQRRREDLEIARQCH